MTPFSDASLDLARTLGQNFLSGRVCRPVFDAIPNLAAAYRVQDLAVTATGLRRLGYKIGATSTQARAFLGVEEAIYGPILEGRLVESGAEFRVTEGLLGFECEFGFRMGRNFPGPDEAISPAGLRAAIAECFPAIEIAGRRVASDLPVTGVATIADFCMAVAVVRGAPIDDWRERDLSAIPVALHRASEIVAVGSGARVLGGPLEPLLWLASVLARSGRPLRAGNTVVTGSCTGVTPVRAGEALEARFADLPAVRVRVV